VLQRLSAAKCGATAAPKATLLTFAAVFVAGNTHAVLESDSLFIPTYRFSIGT
jgi:hypothetical protein